MTADVDGRPRGGRPGRPRRAARGGRCRGRLPRLRGGGLRERSHARRRRRAGRMNNEPKEATDMANVPTDQEASRRSARSSPSIKVPGAENAEPDQTWSDLDVDSLDLVEVVKALEDRYDVQIADGRPEVDRHRRRRRQRSCRSSRARRRARPRDATVVVTGRGVVSLDRRGRRRVLRRPAGQAARASPTASARAPTSTPRSR